MPIHLPDRNTSDPSGALIEMASQAVVGAAETEGGELPTLAEGGPAWQALSSAAMTPATTARCMPYM